MNIYFDLETVPPERNDALIEKISERVQPPASMTKAETIEKWKAEKKPEIIDEQYRRLSLNGGYGQILVIGFAFDDEAVEVLQQDHGNSERDILRQFIAAVAEARSQTISGVDHLTWVGHNVTGFDLRFLLHRCIVHDVCPPFKIPAKARPWDASVYDTMLEWACHQRDAYIGLKELYEILGLPTYKNEKDIDGAEVYDYFLAGDVASIAHHCKVDVERVRRIRKRLEFEV